MNLIIDCSNLLHRCFWVAKSQPLINPQGEDVGCAFKFLRSVFALVKQFQPSKVYTVWDKKEFDADKSYRVNLTEGSYKAGRDKSEEQNIYQNEVTLIKVCETLGIHNFFPKVLEADDVIAWLSKVLSENQNNCTIVSSDKDFLQLVGNRVQVYSPARQKTYTTTNFRELIGVSPSEYLYYKALVGDVADNLKSSELNGIGPKTARKIVAGEKTLSDSQKSAADWLMHLMDLKQGFIEHPEDATFCEEQFKATPIADFQEFRKYCETNGFNSILRDFDKWKSAFTKNRLVELIGSLSK